MTIVLSIMQLEVCHTKSLIKYHQTITNRLQEFITDIHNLLIEIQVYLSMLHICLLVCLLAGASAFGRESIKVVREGKSCTSCPDHCQLSYKVCLQRDSTAVSVQLI